MSLGGGDNKHAVALIERAQEEGLWLIVENLHLATALSAAARRAVRAAGGQQPRRT